MDKKIHIALDFDKTLATHESEWGIDKIGEPIWPMVEKVREWLAKGYLVTIFTARVAPEFHTIYQIHQQNGMIWDFLGKVGLPALPITAIKSPKFSHFLDDRAYHVGPNSGKISDFIDI